MLELSLRYPGSGVFVVLFMSAGFNLNLNFISVSDFFSRRLLSVVDCLRSASFVRLCCVKQSCDSMRLWPNRCVLIKPRSVVVVVFEGFFFFVSNMLSLCLQELIWC